MKLGAPLAVGCLMIGSLVVVQAATITAIVRLMQRETQPQNPSVGWLHAVDVFSRALWSIVLAQLVEIAAWAALFLGVGEFSDFPTAFYHSAVNFTTLRLRRHRDVARVATPRPLEAVAGMLMFGISTAGLFAVVQTLIPLVRRPL